MNLLSLNYVSRPMVALPCGRPDVRYGSLADIGQPIRDVRFTPKSDMLIVCINVCFVPEADIDADAGHTEPRGA